jgi:hypothetical protein
VDQQLMTSVYATKMTACELCVTTVGGDIKIHHIKKWQNPFTNCIPNPPCHNFKVVIHKLSILRVMNDRKKISQDYFIHQN